MKMVSTRQSSNMGGSSGGAAEIEAAGPSRRHQTNSQQSMEPPQMRVGILDLPVEILDKIFGYLGFNSIAHLRPVSKGGFFCLFVLFRF